MASAATVLLGRRRESRLRHRAVLGVALLGTLALLLLAVPWAFAARSSSSSGDRSLVMTESAFEQQTGVRVLRVAMTGGGGLVDLRYQVINAETARDHRHHSPTLVDEATGQAIDAPFMGHSHAPTEPKTGRTYAALFVNEQGAVRQGGEVSVVIGSVRLAHVAVE